MDTPKRLDEDRLAMEAFIEGGFGVLLTTVLGVAALAVVLVHGVAQQSSLRPLIVGVSAAAGFAGLLGFVAGIMNTLGAARLIEEDRARSLVLLTGSRESLHNLVALLVFALLLSLALGVAEAQRKKRDSAIDG